MILFSCKNEETQHKKRNLLITLIPISTSFLPLLAVSCKQRINNVARNLEFKEIRNKKIFLQQKLLKT